MLASGRRNAGLVSVPRWVGILSAAWLWIAGCNADCPWGSTQVGGNCRRNDALTADAAVSDASVHDGGKGDADVNARVDPNASELAGRGAVTGKCGNGKIETGEECECPTGRASCELKQTSCGSVIGGATGTVSCARCRYDLSMCSSKVAPPTPGSPASPAAGGGGGSSGSNADTGGMAATQPQVPAGGTSAPQTQTQPQPPTQDTASAGSSGRAPVTPPPPDPEMNGDTNMPPTTPKQAGSGGRAHGTAGAGGVGPTKPPESDPPAGSDAPTPLMCAEGSHKCGEQCVSNISVATCGSACNSCKPPAHATSTCDGVSCGIACNSGWHLCSGACLDDTAVTSCGARCSPCEVPENATAKCEAHACDFDCNPGFLRCTAFSCGRKLWTFESRTLERFELDTSSSPASAGALSVAQDQHFEGSSALKAPMAAGPSTGKQILLHAEICPGQRLDLSKLTVSANVYLEGPEFPADAFVQIWLWGNGLYHYMTSVQGPKSGAWMSLRAVLGPTMDSSNAYGVAIVVALNDGESWAGNVWLDAVTLE